MKLKFNLNGSIDFLNEYDRKISTVVSPVILEGWNGLHPAKTIYLKCAYTTIEKNEHGVRIGTAIIHDKNFGNIKVKDYYEPENNNEKDYYSLKRELVVEEKGRLNGIRLLYEIELFSEHLTRFEDLRYFAPPAIYDKNDLDEDGVEDYFHTKKTIFRDDRFNYPMFMAFDEKSKLSFRLERMPLPEYDSTPEREIDEETKEPISVFIQKTDIGSMGVDGESGGQVKMMACYPFYEGDATIGLYIIKTVPFGAFWPLKCGEELTVSYRFSITKHSDYHEACWYSIANVVKESKPKAKELQVLPETLVKYRLEALDKYYVEKTEEEDKNKPAGYVLNCHPQNGTQLENIIQYGFTGQNILNAYNVLRYGRKNGDAEYIRKARKTADFFADTIFIKESGMFYNLYNIDTKKVNFWWTGLLLPLAYADGEELHGLMGPLYEYRKEVIDTLSKLKGAYLRCMNEDVISLLRLYLFEKEDGYDHENWIQAIKSYGEFLLKTQEEDGSWHRAYTLNGEPIVEPSIWFGKTLYESRSSTGTSISLLIELYRYTKEQKYLNAAKKAGDFVRDIIIERVRFNGGVHDSIYAKGQLIDNESILYPMFGMLSLYEETREAKYLEGAHKAARLNASWICLWNVPLPKDNTLYKYGFNSIGMGACDTCGCGYVHPFQLMGVAEMAQIAIYTQDLELLETAKLYWQGCNQTVSLPENDWGYAHYGLQEEGYLVSWWAVDDPMFSANTGFGYRLKGEGNKTCFPWINAVGVKAYWSLQDRFDTTDFEQIKKQHFKM